jgi:hypothetical protein
MSFLISISINQQAHWCDQFDSLVPSLARSESRHRFT